MKLTHKIYTGYKITHKNCEIPSRKCLEGNVKLEMIKIKSMLSSINEKRVNKVNSK